MDINKLYETLTGEPYPYRPEDADDALWALSDREGLLRDLPPHMRSAGLRRDRLEPGRPS